jgi:hypothetical protein
MEENREVLRRKQQSGDTRPLRFCLVGDFG